MEIVLAERAVDVDLVFHDVAAEVAIREVDVCQGTVVVDDGNLGAGTTTGVARPIGRAAPSIGTKTVASPRSCSKISVL